MAKFSRIAIEKRPVYTVALHTHIQGNGYENRKF
jgi:hypothetical protein